MMNYIFQNISDELKLATEGFFESESLTIDTSRREVGIVCVREISNYLIMSKKYRTPEKYRNIELSLIMGSLSNYRETYRTLIMGSNSLILWREISDSVI